MSAGSFTTTRYVATYDSTQVHPIRVQPETLQLSVTIGNQTVTNDATNATRNNPISAVVSRGRRSRGLNARLIRVQFSDTPPAGYQPGGVITLPVLNPALMDAREGDTGTYLAQAITVVGTSPEEVR